MAAMKRRIGVGAGCADLGQEGITVAGAAAAGRRAQMRGSAGALDGGAEPLAYIGDGCADALSSRADRGRRGRRLPAGYARFPIMKAMEFSS